MNFKVKISRISHCSKIFVVEAKDEKEAANLALDKACNTEFNSENLDYEVDGVIREK